MDYCIVWIKHKFLGKNNEEIKEMWILRVEGHLGYFQRVKQVVEYKMDIHSLAQNISEN